MLYAHTHTHAHRRQHPSSSRTIFWFIDFNYLSKRKKKASKMGWKMVQWFHGSQGQIGWYATWKLEEAMLGRSSHLVNTWQPWLVSPCVAWLPDWFYPLVTKHGNRKSPMNGGFSRKITHIFIYSVVSIAIFDYGRAHGFTQGSHATARGVGARLLAAATISQLQEEGAEVTGYLQSALAARHVGGEGLGMPSHWKSCSHSWCGTIENDDMVDCQQPCRLLCPLNCSTPPKHGVSFSM